MNNNPIWQLNSPNGGGSWDKYASLHEYIIKNNLEVHTRGNGFVEISERSALNQPVAEQQQNQNKTERTDGMLHIVAVTQTPSPQETTEGKGELILVAPEAVAARDPNTAILLVGAKHAAMLKDAPGDRVVVQVRQGV